MSKEREWTALDRAVLRILHDGVGKCGDGFGKYPLGVKAAVDELLPLVQPLQPDVERALRAFEERLAR